MNSIDQLGRTLTFTSIPKRMVSLVPSQTEYLYELGLHEELLGITKFCIHPEGLLKEKKIIGGTKNIDIQKILELKPEVVIANKEENEQEQIEELMQHVPVWISDIYTLQDSYEMMLGLGKLFDKQSEAESIVNKIKTEFAALQKFTKTKRVAYFIWRNPYMLAGKNTFIHHMLSELGLYNVCNDMERGERYPSISLEALSALQPELIYLSSEPYPFKEKHIEECQKACPNARVQLVDGELFSWYGSRLQHSVRYFHTLLQA